MSAFLPEDRKATAVRLTETMATHDGIRTLRLLARLCRPEPKPESVDLAAVLEAGANSKEVGVWRREGADKSRPFVRISSREQPLWADVDLIGPKRGRRVVLLGESVARGYLYDPHFNLAGAMRSMIASANPGEEVEVVDLARLGLTYEQLLRLLASSLALDPDVLIVFAGNNWNPYWSLNSTSLAEISEQLRETNDWRTVRTYVEHKLRARAAALLGGLSQLSKLRRIPVILVLPEFNLGAWRSNCEETIDWLPASHARRWRSFKQEANRALQARDWSGAGNAAQELIALDNGSASTGLEILGRCKSELEEHAQARKLLESARDTVLYRPGNDDSPRCFTLVHELFRSDALQNGLNLVDVPRLFEEHLERAVPDSRMFLDSCHYTVPAIGVAVAGIVESLLPLLGAPAVSRQELQRIPLDVGSRCRAMAHFIAAVHNAHFGQLRETVEYHTRAAVEHSPDVRGDMIKFLDAHVRRTSYSLCHSFHEVEWLGGSGSAMNLAINGEREKLLSPTLMECLFEMVEPEEPGIRDQMHARLESSLGANGAIIDLLEPLYSAVGHTFRESSRYAYHRSMAPESIFRFPGHRGNDLIISITLRVPSPADPDEEIEILVNERPISRLAQSRSWSSHIIQIPGAVVVNGLNLIALRWPAPAQLYGQAIKLVADDLEAGIVPQFTCVHGEIHELRAAPTGQFQPDAERSSRSAQLLTKHAGETHEPVSRQAV